MGDFSHPDVCCRFKVAEHKQFSNFWDCTDNYFLTQVTEEPKRGKALLLMIIP